MTFSDASRKSPPLEEFIREGYLEPLGEMRDPLGETLGETKGESPLVEGVFVPLSSLGETGQSIPTSSCLFLEEGVTVILYLSLHDYA